MGIFKFNRAAGRHLNDEAAIEAIKHAGHPVPKAPRENIIKRAFKQYGLSQLSMAHVVVHDNTITIKGHAETAAQRDHMILAAGNIAGIDTVNSEITVPPGTPAPNFHQVEAGETLADIAEKVDANVTADDLRKANKPVLENEGGIYPGQTIRIPEA
ncbi:LysM peptidoglycan-binding domain-containing protein [Kozakia baliensis]|uniref:LysM peptidoglycan-binding domain-containing protein n=1 Tax=Kozakia baliensis TaxID=153496 RepID=UPI000496359D|nr:LysM peptidoglycan-binding domain-containing protein [Kozakia baliensis]